MTHVIGASPTEIRQVGKYAQSFAARHKAQIDAAIERLGSDIDLKASTSDIDVLLAETEGWPPLARHGVLVNQSRVSVLGRCDVSSDAVA